MKKLLFLFLLLLSCQSDKQEAVITGTIDHLSPKGRLQLDIIADERQHAVVAEIPVSDDGTFSYSQPVDKPTVASIIISDKSIGKERITLYLQKGKSVHVELRHVQEADGTTITILPTFSGDMQAESAFVNDNVSVDPRNFDTFTAYKDSVDKIYADRLERAQAIGNPVFVEEYLSVNDPSSHHVRLVNYIPHDANLDSVETAYKDFINSLDFDDPINEAALQQYLITYGRFVQKKNEGGSATMPALEELVRRTRNQSMRNNISSHLMFFFLMIDTPYVETVWAKYNEICNDKSQIEELRPRYDARRKELKNVKANRPLPSS